MKNEFAEKLILLFIKNSIKNFFKKDVKEIILFKQFLPVQVRNTIYYDKVTYSMPASVIGSCVIRNMKKKILKVKYYRCKHEDVCKYIKMGSEEILKVNNFCYSESKLQRMKKSEKKQGTSRIMYEKITYSVNT